MHELNDLDLNLLRTLVVLLEQRSVTKAAKVLHRSQPAVSHALARLRRTLGDPLLVREGAHMVPTPRARRLGPPLKRLLGDLAHVVLETHTFEPSTSRREFILAAPDVLAPFVGPLIEGFADAPHIRLRLVTGRGTQALEDADLLLDVMPSRAPGCRARALGFLQHCTAMRRNHPASAQTWTLQAFTNFAHVLVRTGTDAPSLVQTALRSQGATREVGVVVPSVLLAPYVAASTNLFYTGPRPLLEPLAEPLGLHLKDCVVDLPKLQAAAVWKERDDHDPGHRWFRQCVISTMERRLSPTRTDARTASTAMD